MTFSLVARCAKTGQLGMVISSSSPAVAARCSHVRAGVGVVASQNITDPGLGPELLDHLAQGKSGAEALAVVTKGRAHIDYRQLLVVDAAGNAVAVTYTLNGVKTAEFDLSSKDWKDKVAGSKFASMKAFGTKDKGHIVLQDHGDVVMYRNIKIRPIGAAKPSAAPTSTK